MMTILRGEGLSVAYRDKQVLKQIDIEISRGTITAILGPNGSGKSTLLKALSRNLQPNSGAVYLQGTNLYSLKAKAVARQMAFLPQTPTAPLDLTVRDLVEYGRFPYQSWWRGRLREDDDIVAWALAQTALTAMAERLVGTLSGGERQRVWLAMALAQKPDILLLDEPTTYLDISHQIEILELLGQLNREHGITVVMVLHDINHAARYSNQIVVLKEGEIAAHGTPQEVINAQILRAVFGVTADIWTDRSGRPVCLIEGLSNHDKN